MATVDELTKQYKRDPELKKEVKEILKDGKITPKEFLELPINDYVDLFRCSRHKHGRQSHVLRQKNGPEMSIHLRTNFVPWV
jgi:hypothetical protein